VLVGEAPSEDAVAWFVRVPVLLEAGLFSLPSFPLPSLLLSLLVGRALFKIFSIMLPFSVARIGCVNKAPTDANAKIAAMRYILLFIRTNLPMYNIYEKLRYVPNAR
jgi:hypothetical protein